MENPGNFAFEELLAGIDDAPIANVLPELANNVGYVPPNFNELYINWNLDYNPYYWDNIAVPLPVVHLPLHFQQVDNSE
jgi:hypothetical protein